MKSSPEAVQPSPPRTQPRVALVEGVRLIILALFTTGGWIVAEGFSLKEADRSIAIALGALLGYVFGGVFGRSTVSALTAVERRFQKASAAEILAGTVGLILGLLVAFLLTLPVLRLTPAAAYPTTAFIYLTLALVGYRVGGTKRDEFFGLFGMKPRAAGSGSELTVVDTSALIDGRIADVVRSGFLGGTLLVPDGVLHELRAIEAASDPPRRERGRRGLATIDRLQHDPRVEVVLVDGVPEVPGEEVDRALVKLARDRGASLVTNDVPLAERAEDVGVPVRSVTRLALALLPTVTVGQELDVRLAKAGREAGQGVGYLEDGTMVVVHGARERVGHEVHVRVTNLQTTTSGRLLFAELAETARG
jgi:uncharacterized protein YacL